MTDPGFFQRQQDMGARVRKLVLLCAVASLPFILFVEVVLILGYAFFGPAGARVPAALLVGGALVAAGFIVFITLAYVARLRRGPAALAEMIGARRLAPDSRDLLERRFLGT